MNNETPPEVKRQVLQDTIAQFQAVLYQNEIMGRTWHKIGNTQGAQACAEKHAESAKVIAELEGELKSLDA